jgi:hypothetical protein
MAGTPDGNKPLLNVNRYWLPGCAELAHDL